MSLVSTAIAFMSHAPKNVCATEPTQRLSSTSFFGTDLFEHHDYIKELLEACGESTRADLQAEDS